MTAKLLNDLRAAQTLLDSYLTTSQGITSMDDDDVSVIDTPAENTEASDYDKQKASLQAYLDALPYKGESPEEMQLQLENIIEKMIVCSRTKNWNVLTTWDGVLQGWLLMRYPMHKTTRAKLVHFYYELCLLPGLEPRIIRSWADMLSRLLSNRPGLRRKLESTDLTLPWQPLWRILQKELWPKSSMDESSRNLVNILLFVAEQCKRYYPSSEIPDMLDAFLPLLTRESVLTTLPVLTSFLPPTNTDLYLPVFFTLWEAFNSNVIDDRILEMCGDLAEEHVSGTAGSEGGTAWKDVGIWTQPQWNAIVGKGLSSMAIPVGSGMHSTASYADLLDKSGGKVKKTISKISALAKLLVYSMSVDGPVRATTTAVDGSLAPQEGFLAGSRALDTLDRMMTSFESYFHPSNTGPWTVSLTTFLQRLGSEFIRRWKEEEQDSCKTPVTQRLTPAIRRAFVNILKTPAMLAMFSKDSIAMSFAQGALRAIATLEPNLVMPELLDRAYGGLEVVNETHRTTAVLSTLSGVARLLVTESIWLPGQKHIVPLLELCLPGIDLNDPAKTVCATMFIVSVVQHIKIGDLSQSGMSFTGDEPADESMNVDDTDHLPEGTDLGDVPQLTKAEERSLVRDSTAGFADWVVSLFRRVFNLYENLPEEGGKKNTTGGKQEESVLKSIKGMLDVICLHLSEPLFDLVLKLVYDYATTNAKSNGVRAFGQLVACLARVNAEKTIAKFLPNSLAQIEEELKHGASSIRTTSTHAAVPSDTTLHWNLAILRGCLGYGGTALLKHRTQIIHLIRLLVEKTKSERGYTGTARLITRVINTVSTIYPLNSRFVNAEEWTDQTSGYHASYWGRLYEPQDVVVDWHVPNDDEIAFVLQIIDEVGVPTLRKVQTLVGDSSNWDSVARNDFCRYLHASRAILLGLPTFLKHTPGPAHKPFVDPEFELPELLVSHLDVNAGFTLTDPEDARYKRVIQWRQDFSRVVLDAARALRSITEGEDHTDAVIGVTRAIDTYLLAYAVSRSEFDSLQKNFAQARDLNRSWLRQKENSRIVFLKRAQVYHTGRIYMHSLYRRRSETDDKMLMELVELSLSPYTRVRRQAQGVLHSATGYFVRSTRFILPTLFKALEKGTDPDRMKGALYILWNKGVAAYALTDQHSHKEYLLSVLECHHEEKPSIQKLVGSISHDCLSNLCEEAVPTESYQHPTPRLDIALTNMETDVSQGVNQALLRVATQKSAVRVRKREELYSKTVAAILGLASSPTTHWRYVQMASCFLYYLLRRDVAPSPELVQFLLNQTTSPQPSIRTTVQRALLKVMVFIKIRSFSTSVDEMWWDEWKSPLSQEVQVRDPNEFLRRLQQQDLGSEDSYFDNIKTGFILWSRTIKGYRPILENDQPLKWDSASEASLIAIRQAARNSDYLEKLAVLWSQESNRGVSLDIRSENMALFKYLAKFCGADGLDTTLGILEPLLFDSYKYKQRAGAEILAGLLRGSKHWNPVDLRKLWSWVTERLHRIIAQVTPETISFWESIFQYILAKRDPRRNKPIISWILSMPLEFNGNSAFEMTKVLSLFGLTVGAMGVFFNPKVQPYIELFFQNANSGYAEIRQHICQNLYNILNQQWQPSYPSTTDFVAACKNQADPLLIRRAPYLPYVRQIIQNLPKWREERLPPPRVNQSEYDKVGLTLLQWLWVTSHGHTACLMFPYALELMPEILRMSELADSSDLQAYSSAVLYNLAAVAPPPEYIDVILGNFTDAIKSSKSWRIRRHALPALVVFFYQNLLSISHQGIGKVMDVLLDCLSDENVEVREMASKVFSGVVRCSQRQSIIPLKNRFVTLARRIILPPRKDPSYAESLRKLHSAILGICALIESTPYSVEPWLPPLTEVLAPHATDPPPISTTIRKCASEFKKTHQDTWHKDQLSFNEDQLQSLSSMLVGTSYYA